MGAEKSGMRIHLEAHRRREASTEQLATNKPASVGRQGVFQFQNSQGELLQYDDQIDLIGLHRFDELFALGAEG